MTTADLSPLPPPSMPEVPPKIARLWRERGQEFLDLHREAIFEEVERLHAIIDLGGEEVVIDLREGADTDLHCHRHLQHGAVARCTDCGLPFCNDCLVDTPSERYGQVCVNCALELAGIRVRHH